MDQIRATFLVFLSIFTIGAATAAYYSQPAEPAARAQQNMATLVPQVTPISIAENTLEVDREPVVEVLEPKPTRTVPTPVATAPARGIQAIFAPNRQASDGLPTFVCGTAAEGPYLTLVNMQASNLDVAHGFHLGIVPFGDTSLAMQASEAQRATLLRSGQLDCLLTSTAAVAANNSGRITSLTGIGTQPEQLWTRGIQTSAGLAGARLTFEAGGAGERAARTWVAQLGIDAGTVTLLPADTLAQAIQSFAAGTADAVIGSEPAILDAAAVAGATQVLAPPADSPARFVIAVSDNARAQKPDLTAQFHEAWFDAIRMQNNGLDGVAQRVATWGETRWSGISKADSLDDWRAATRSVALITLSESRSALASPDDLEGLPVDASFLQRVVVAAAENGDLPETEFIATQAPGAPDAQRLDCGRLDLGNGPGPLPIETRSELDVCVFAAMSQSPATALRIRSGSAWPGPKGAYTQTQVENAARLRAKRIVDYLTSRGIDPARFEIITLLPPIAHRETTDLSVQAQDYFEELTLFAIP